MQAKVTVFNIEFMNKEEINTTEEMFEGLKDEISGLKKNIEFIKSAVNGMKELIENSLSKKPQSPEDVKKDKEHFHSLSDAIKQTMTSYNKKLESIDNNHHLIVAKLEKLHETMDVKSGKTLFDKINNMSRASGISIYIEFLLAMAIVAILSFACMLHWKSLAEQNEENAMKYRIVRVHGGASAMDIEWMDSVYLVQDQHVIDKIEKKVDVFEKLSKQKADSIIHKMSRRKEMIN